MSHYRDAKAGKFYLNREDSLPTSPDQDPPFLRFARKQGVGVDLWKGEGGTAVDLLRDAGLNWRVHGREVLVPARPRQDDELDLFASDRPGLAEARGYRALVRPDTEEIMAVVTAAYRVAENRWVAEALEDLSSRLEAGPPVIAATSHGREHERTLFVGRVTATPDEALCLLAYNTHGGEGAVRFQLAEANRRTGTTYVLDSEHAAMAIPHVGDLEDRLRRASSRDQDETFVERYLAETRPLWDRLSDNLWTRRHTAALIKE